MVAINKTSSFTYRFLNENDFAELHKTFLEAFSDYATTLQLTVEQLRTHILNNAVDLGQSVGCFVETKMVGFTMNGFGQWKGKFTAYDAGTGVTREFRRRGASRAMFEFMTPVLRERGVEQLLLEVITTNEKAVNLYRGLGFQRTRTLQGLRAAHPLKLEGELPAGMTIREMPKPDWELLQTFWDGSTSWQNSPDAVERIRNIRITAGAFEGDKCIGYAIFSDSGNIAQLAVDKDHRNRGVGSLLLSHIQAHNKTDKPLQTTNLDDSLTETIRFLHNWGFAEVLSQYEMIKPL